MQYAYMCTYGYIYVYIYIYIYIYPVRCAHTPPPCNFSASVQLSRLVLMFSILFQNHFAKKCWNQERKTRAVRSGFSTIWKVRIVIFSHVGEFRHPLEPVLRTWGIVVILMATPVRKRIRFFSKNTSIDTLCRSCVLHVFLNVLFIGFLWFWVPGDSILASILTRFWQPWASEKTVTNV